jgi:D-3-phosphoglycerate dehydrogenase/C-terminal binding protein
MSRFNILVSAFTREDADVELAAAGDAAVLDIVRIAPGAATPLPPDLCARADAIAHTTATQPLSATSQDCPRCKIVIRNGVGYDNIDIAAWGARGVPVCNVPDYGTAEVADHAIALMLAFTRGTATYVDALKSDLAGKWTHAIAPLVMRHRGATFGVVGLGRIGTAAALRARAFGMDVAFHDPYLPSGMEIALGFRRCASLAELMGTSDVVSLHVPLSEETRGLIGAAALAAAKPGLILVNTARGPVVDLDALYEALKARRIAAAALDVLPEEPPSSGHPLIAAFIRREPWLDGRLTLTPHAAFYSPASLVDLRRKTIETLVEFLRDGRLKNCVNSEFLPQRRPG